MGYKTITQIILIVIALVLIFTYIKPTLITIRGTQDELFQLTDTVGKATELNQQLADLIAAEKSFKRSDMASLEAYLPSEIDTMVVMSDVVNMANQSDITVSSMKAGEQKEPLEDVIVEGEKIETEKTSSIEFELSLSGTYESLKNLLLKLEQNKYPLEIISLSFDAFTQAEDGAVTTVDLLETEYTLILRAYSYTQSIN